MMALQAEARHRGSQRCVFHLKPSPDHRLCTPPRPVMRGSCHRLARIQRFLKRHQRLPFHPLRLRFCPRPAPPSPWRRDYIVQARFAPPACKPVEFPTAAGVPAQSNRRGSCRTGPFPAASARFPARRHPNRQVRTSRGRKAQPPVICLFHDRIIGQRYHRLGPTSLHSNG